MLAPLALPNAPGLLHAKKKIGKKKGNEEKKEGKERREESKEKKEREKEEGKKEGKERRKDKKKKRCGDHFCFQFLKQFICYLNFFLVFI